MTSAHRLDEVGRAMMRHPSLSKESLDESLNPVEGYTVHRAVNRKKEFGIIPLRDAVAVGISIHQVLSNNGIVYSKLGASNLGIDVAVPQAYLNERPTSNLFEVQIRKEDEGRTVEAMGSAGWAERNAMRYFSLTFVNRFGMDITVPTITNQRLFTKKEDTVRLYASAIFSPADYYIVQGGTVHVVHLEALQTLGETMAYKLLRAAGRDKRDMVQISLANDLKNLFGESGIRVIAENVRDNPAARKKLRDGIDIILKELKPHKDDGKRLRRNMKVLSELKRL